MIIWSETYSKSSVSDLFRHIAIILLTVLALSHPPVLSASEEKKAGVYHIVICWLKEPDNKLHRQKLIDGTKELRSIPGVLSIEVGEMLPSKRAVVDSSYDIGIVMTFKDNDAMRSYLRDPRHQKAAKEILAPLTSNVVMYDLVKQ